MAYPATNLYPQATGLYPGDGVELPPIVTTGGASELTISSARLAGSIDPNDLQTHYVFEYGNPAVYGYSSATWVAGTAPVNVSRVISGLSSATHYHYRLVAWNAAGTTYGADATFATDFARDDARVLPVHTADRAQ